METTNPDTPPSGQISGYVDPWSGYLDPWNGDIRSLREDLDYQGEIQRNVNADGAILNIEGVEEERPQRTPNDPVDLLIDTGASDHLMPAPCSMESGSHVKSADFSLPMERECQQGTNNMCQCSQDQTTIELRSSA